MNLDESEQALIQIAAKGDASALSRLLTLHRGRLERMIQARLDRRLSARMDTSDVLQEVNMEVFQRFGEFLRDQNVPLITWLRFLTKQKLIEIVRRNVDAQKRDVRREQSIQSGLSDESSAILARHYTQQVSSPSSSVSKKEIRKLVMATMEQLSEVDRTILVLRHVEQLTSEEAAAELGISGSTCRQRHLRALKRLKDLLEQHSLDWNSR
jgi:RNA polymerase sigma-70 factor, ECF subfamily